MKQSLTGIDFKNTSSILAGVQSKNQITVPDGSRLSFGGEVLIRSFGTWTAVMGNFSHASGGSNPDSYGFNVIFRPTTVVFSYGEKGVSAYKTATIDYSATLNTFFKFRAEYFNGKISLFINDEIVGTVSVGTIAFLNSYFIVGRWSRIFNDYFFNGIVKTAKVSIDDVTVLFYDFTLPTATDLVKDRTVNKNDGSILGASPLVKSTGLYPKINLVKPFINWDTLASEMVVTGPYKAKMSTSQASRLSMINLNTKPNTVYTVKANHNGRLGVYKGGTIPIRAYGSEQTFTFNSGQYDQLSLYFNNAVPGDFFLEDVMVYEGTVDVPFAPYELANKPAILYPKKNLFNISDLKDTAWVVNALYKMFNLKPNTFYTLSTNCPLPDNGTANIYFNGSSTAANGVSLGKSVTVKTDSTGNLYVAVPYNPDRQYTQDIINRKYYIQLEEGSSATDYEPYQTGMKQL